MERYITGINGKQQAFTYSNCYNNSVNIYDKYQVLQ